MLITVTERAQFKRCRRQWNWASMSREGLEPLLPKIPLYTGTLIHKGLELWQHDPEGNLVRLYMENALRSKALFIERYKALVGVPPSDQELKPINEAIQLAGSMCVNYQKMYGHPVPEGFELIQPEQKVIVPIPGTKHDHTTISYSGESRAETSMACIGTYGCPRMDEDGWPYGQHYLEGRLDLVLVNKSQRLYVLDYKTFERHPNDDEIRSNDQFLGYLWILQQLNIGPVAGIIYDGLWKRACPPETRTGKKWTFDDLFYRKTFFRPPSEVEEFGQELVYEAFDMAADPPIYKNRRYDCGSCSFEQLCTAVSRDDSWQELKAQRYVKREEEPDDEL